MELVQQYLVQWDSYLSYTVGANTVKDYCMAFLLFLGLFLIFKLFKRVVVGKLHKLALKTANDIDDELIKVIEGISPLFYYVLALYFPFKMLVTSESFDRGVEIVFVIVVVYQLIKSVQELVTFALETWASNTDGKGKAAKTTFQGLRIVVSIVVWSIGILLVLSNLGVNITSLVASLGIGGIAIALAVQNILADMFSSFSIYFDKPFVVGDYILVGKDEGTVKKIGLKTTRVETLQGEELVISNKELTTARVQNFKKLKSRRVAVDIGVTYGTSTAKLKKINGLVEKVIKSVNGVEFSRSHFRTFGDFSLQFEVVYYVLSNEYVEYMNKQQEINFGIREMLEKEKISMAFPTQTIHLQK
ncbi:mechanosensitive ion channel family protein [Candidatus Peregrinibacteria bacterium]|jgi:small-conductance mechanosensitive channel|nr:mechanosensitive ion channel family protein [Candidatus Peregrinibacteria bacterium]MBT7736857.1 mechanosensitive ion channel family protein [Candidatus Peregrinibacteria bacterium]